MPLQRLPQLRARYVFPASVERSKVGFHHRSKPLDVRSDSNCFGLVKPEPIASLTAYSVPVMSCKDFEVLSPTLLMNPFLLLDIRLRAFLHGFLELLPHLVIVESDVLK